MIQWKLGCRSRKQKRKTQPIARPEIEHCHWFILPLLLATPTMQFSLDRKRRSHKQNQCSASDSVGLIFTRSYRFTLLITTPTPSLVKTSLYDPVKTGLSESEAEAEDPTNCKARNWTLSLVYSSASACDSDNASFHLIVSDGVISKISVLLPTPSVWFLLHRIRFTLLVTTPAPTPTPISTASENQPLLILKFLNGESTCKIYLK